VAKDAPSRSIRGRARLVLALLVVAALVVATGWTVRAYFQVEEVRLPDLAGQSVTEATRILRNASLVPETFAENVPGAAANTVTTQAPPAGAVVRRGRTVSLGVNTPPETARVPVLVGLTQTEATQRLRDLNLAAGQVTFAYSDRNAGLVIDQDPDAGAGLGASAAIGLVVSRGPQRADATLPDLAGVDVDQAVRQLEELGFTRVETAAATVSFDRPRAVTGQRPAPGETVPVSTAVTLLYALPGNRVVQVPELQGMTLRRAQIALRAANLSLGHVEYIRDASRPTGVVEAAPGTYTVVGSPIRLVVNGEPSALDRLLERGGFEPPTTERGEDPVATDPVDSSVPDRRAIPFTFDPASMGVRSLVEEAYHLRLVVDDREGERTILDRDVDAGEIISTTVTVYGPDALLQTFINGVPFQAWRP
jgi:serine/threonine-protein kinase